MNTSDELLSKYGTPIIVAEQLLRNKLNGREQSFVSEILNKTILDAARIRLESKSIKDRKKDKKILKKSIKNFEKAEAEKYAIVTPDLPLRKK